MKLIVYTVVINNYDFVLPPFYKDECVDYVVVTDNEKMQVKGWKTVLIDPSLEKKTPSMINRYYKFFPNRFFPQYDFSIYIDGNVRVVGSVNKLIDDFEKSCSVIGLLKHPTRESVLDEVDSCIRMKKINNPDDLKGEYERYLNYGFQDSVGLTENNVILRKHNDLNLVEAMSFWWECLESSSGRDQISLPYVREKFNLSEKVYLFNTRIKNPYFRIYPHRKGRFYLDFAALLRAKGLTNFFYKILSNIYERMLKLFFIVNKR